MYLANHHAGDGLLHQVLSQARVVSPVGLDQALEDAPGGLDRSVVPSASRTSRRLACASMSRLAPVCRVRLGERQARSEPQPDYQT